MAFVPRDRAATLGMVERGGPPRQVFGTGTVPFLGQKGSKAVQPLSDPREEVGRGGLGLLHPPAPHQHTPSLGQSPSLLMTAAAAWSSELSGGEGRP